MVHLDGEVLRRDGGLFTGRFANDIQRQFVKGAAFQILLPQPLRERFCSLPCESDEQNLFCRDMLNVYEVPDLSHRGHGLAAAGTAYHQDVIFERNYGFALLRV